MSTFLLIEQGQIQSVIDSSTAEKLHELEAEAKAVARESGRAIRLGTNIPAYKDRYHIAIEMLVRLETTRKRKGWWFRAKRRAQLTKEYTASPY